MTASGYDLVVRIADPLFSVVLAWPRDLALLVLGFACALALPLLRLLTTDRHDLRVIHADERRLKELRRNARHEQDRNRTARLRTVRALVARRRARCELPYLLAAAGFLLTVFAWGTARLPFLPIRNHQPVSFILRVPDAGSDQVAHLVPQDGVQAVDGWIRPLGSSTNADQSAAGHETLQAVWRLTFEESNQPRHLIVRMHNGSYGHPVLANGRTYAPRVVRHPDGAETELLLEPYAPLGLLPPEVIEIPTWALLLSLITAAGSMLLRRVWAIP